MTNLNQDVTDILIRERLIVELGETIDRNLSDIKAGKGISIEEARKELFG